MKKIATFILSLVLATQVWAYDFQSGSLYYNITSNTEPYTVEVTYSWNYYIGYEYIPSEVSYNGKMYTVTGIGKNAFQYCNSLTGVSIPNSVTSIGEGAFNNCDGLTSITIPNSVTSIGNRAFYDCDGLTSITIPNPVATIGDYTFYDCNGLTSVTIPNSVTSIGECAFNGCSGLTSVTIPNSVTSIGYEAFYNCSSLTSVNISNSVTSIGYYAFDNCNSLQYNEYDNALYLGNAENPYLVLVKAKSHYITSCEINTNCKIIGRYAFDESNLTSITIPNAVATIGDYAFGYCSDLTSVTIGNSVTSIGNSAFRHCSGLTSVTIPNSVTSIDNYAFEDCNSLQYNEYGNALYLGNAENPYLLLVKAKSQDITSCEINANCKIIGGYAFDESNLTSITIPNSVTSIGMYAFRNCVTNITIPNTITNIVFDAFYGVKNIVYSGTAYPETQTWGALTRNGVVDGSFVYADAEKTKLTGYFGNSGAVEIPETVAEIGSNAFSYCSGLTSVTIPQTVKKIGYQAFYLVKNIVYSGSATGNPWGALAVNGTVDGDFIYSDAEKTTLAAYIGNSSNVSIPTNVTTIGLYAFYNCSSLSTLTISENVKTISNYALAKCVNLTTLNFNATNCNDFPVYVYSNVGSYANESNISTINIGNNVTRLPARLCYSCKNITSVIIPNSVTSIGIDAFNGCSSLTSVTIGNAVTTIGKSAFSECSSLTSITIPNGVTTIGDRAFEDCEAATSITIPASVTSIGSRAFAYCSSPTSVDIPSSVVSIGDGAFNYIKNINYTGTAGTETETWGALTRNGIVDGDFMFADAAKTQLTVYRGNGGSVTIPNGVVSIGETAFAESAVTSVTIPNSVTSIGEDAFYGCENLTSVSVGNSVTRVGSWAFGGSENLQYNEYDNAYYLGNSQNPYVILVQAKSDTITHCNIHANTKAIQGRAFRGCNLASIVLPNAITCIEDKTFSDCDELQSITIPETVSYIGDEVFYECRKLQSLTLPEAVTFIGEYAFAYCSRLKSINIPAAVDTIGPSAFSSCDSLTAVAYESNFNLSEHKYSWNLYFTKDSLKYQVLNKNEVSVYSNILNAKNVVIPETVNAGKDYRVVRINGDAFYRYSDNQLESVSIPASIDSIGSDAFNYCNKLREVEFASVESMCKIKFYNYRSNPLSCNSQYSTSNVKLYIAGEEVTDLIIPETIDSIGSYTFYGCKGLNTIVIPATVTKIDEDAFYIASNNGKKTTFYCEAPSKPSGWNGNWTEGYNSYTIVWGRVMRSGFMFELSDDNTAKITGYFGNETSVTIPEKIICGGTEYTVNAIGSSVFKDNADIELVAIPTSVTTIENSAFNGCTSLESIEIHNKMTTINDSAFYNCYNLTIYCQAKSKPAGWKNKWNLSINEDQIVWNAQMIAVTLTSNNSAWGTVSGSGNYVANRQVTIIATPATGYHFVKWSDNNTEASRTITVTAAVTLTATFEENAVEEVFTIQAIANNAAFGTVTGSAVYTAGTTATLEATPAKGYKFVKWNDENTDNPRQVVVNSYMNFTAFFEKDSVANDTTPKQFMVMAISNNAAYGMVSGSAVYDAGAQAVLAAVATDSCKFVMWSDSVTDNPRTITITADLTLTAIFELASENQGGNKQGNENQGGNEQGNENQGGNENNQGTAVAESSATAINIYAHGNTIVVKNADAEIRVYNAMGALVGREAQPSVSTEIQINTTGVYIVKVGTMAKRVMIND